MQRAASIANGYHSARTGPADLAQRSKQIAALAAEAGRPVPTISVRARVRFDQDPISVYSMCGSSSMVAHQVQRFVDVGTEHLIVVLEETDPTRLREIAYRFQTECVEPVILNR
jgi:alkanesulfonate monooxygenase SsuD/methylene tetrahydromethanopterin reductase-like flavin-dependent oxidoreductase (luciferase family)